MLLFLSVLFVSFFAAREDFPVPGLVIIQASGIWNLEFGLRLRRAVVSVVHLFFASQQGPAN